jgi:hypothetical protein
MLTKAGVIAAAVAALSGHLEQSGEREEGAWNE